MSRSVPSIGRRQSITAACAIIGLWTAAGSSPVGLFSAASGGETSSPVDSVVTKPHADAVRAPKSPLAPVNLRFADETAHETPSFRRHVVPLLGKLGCNGRACHGSFQGRGGFRLSLFGYDFKMDHQVLLAGDDEPRVDPKHPQASLILRKPTLLIPHEGGLRYKIGSWEHRLLLKWIEGGAAGVKDSDPDFARLEVKPNEIRFNKKGDQAALRAIAHWSDGSAEDVTPLCRFQSNDDQIAKIDKEGRVTAGTGGDSHVVVFYDVGVVPVPVMQPVSDIVGDRYPDVPAPTEIDRLVQKKLRKVGIVPSGLCSDAEFLRRVSLDLTGTLPRAEEAVAFLTDTRPDKRELKVDELLARPSYAAWWTTRLCDMTDNNDRALNNLTPSRPGAASQEWYDWLLKRVEANVSYDKIVEGMVLANSRRPGQTYTEYTREMSDLYHKDSHANYADRPCLPHFWSRATVRQPEQKALSFAHTFLGIRIQCAQCHKHPFDQWTQQDYKDFAKFFDRVRYGVDPLDRPQYDAVLASLKNEKTRRPNDLRNEFPRILAEGKIVPFEELYVNPPFRRAPVRAIRPQPLKSKGTKPAIAKATGAHPAVLAKPQITKATGDKKTLEPSASSRLPVAQKQPGQLTNAGGIVAKAPAARAAGSQQRKPVVAARPLPRRPLVARRPNPKPKVVFARLLRGDVIDLTHCPDPRVPLMNWLRSPKNRYFARAFVNRVWANYFNVGIVNPTDDLSLANPPSNAELLDYLADGFIKHHYDMKWLHREIVNSRTYQLSWRPNETNRLDERNFSHAVVRRMPAEVAYDAVRQATASDSLAARMQTDGRVRAIDIPGTVFRRQSTASSYALTVLGRSVRSSNCDCDRSDEPSLLQTVFLRNDYEILSMINDPRNGWVAQIAKELQPKPLAAKPSARPGATKDVSKTAPKNIPSKPAVAKPTTAAKPASAKPTARKPVVAQKPVPAMHAREIAALTERIKRLQAAGKTEEAKKLTVRLAELKRGAARPNGAPPRPALARIKPSQLSADKKKRLVRTAYLRTLTRYPDERETTRALAYINDSGDIASGLRDLMWALVNTEEFIVNH